MTKTTDFDQGNLMPVETNNGVLVHKKPEVTENPSDFWFVEKIMKVLDKVALDAKNGKQVCDIYAFHILDIVRGKDEKEME